MWTIELLHSIQAGTSSDGFGPAGVNIPGASPEALQKSKSVVWGAHASRVSVWASRPNHPNRFRRDAEGSRRDACAPRTNAIQAEASFGVLDPMGIKKRPPEMGGL